MGSNPCHGKVVFSGLFSSSSFFLPLSLSLSLTCMGIILDHKVTRSRRDKERKKMNPNSAICAANAVISAMYEEKMSIFFNMLWFTTFFSLTWPTSLDPINESSFLFPSR